MKPPLNRESIPISSIPNAGLISSRAFIKSSINTCLSKTLVIFFESILFLSVVFYSSLGFERGSASLKSAKEHALLTTASISAPV